MGKSYGIKMGNYAVLYKGRGRDWEQEKKSAEKKLAKDRKMRDDGDKDWVKEELKEKKQRERRFSFLK